MNSPKEKAEELFQKYYNKYGYYGIPVDAMKNSKEMALIAVDLHLEELSKMKLIFSDRELHYKYWEEVKTEIEKL